MLTSLLLLGLLTADGRTSYKPVNPIFAPIYTETCTSKKLNQTVDYPAQLLGTRISGVVVLVLFLNPCGEVRHVIISQSSGTPDLDRAAVESAKNWVISPERADLPEGRGGMIRLPVEFVDRLDP